MATRQRREIRLELMAEAAQRIRDRGDYAETRGGKLSRSTIKAIPEEYEYLLHDEWWEKYRAAKASLPPGSCIFPAWSKIPGKPRRRRLRSWLDT